MSFIKEAKEILATGIRQSDEASNTSHNTLFQWSKSELEKICPAESWESKEFIHRLSLIDCAGNEVARCVNSHNERSLRASLINLKDAVDQFTDFIDRFAIQSCGVHDDVLESINARWGKLWWSLAVLHIYDEPEQKKIDPIMHHYDKFNIMRASPLVNLFVLTRYAGLKLHRTLPTVANIRG